MIKYFSNNIIKWIIPKYRIKNILICAQNSYFLIIILSYKFFSFLRVAIPLEEIAFPLIQIQIANSQNQSCNFRDRI